MPCWPRSGAVSPPAAHACAHRHCLVVRRASRCSRWFVGVSQPRLIRCGSTITAEVAMESEQNSDVPEVQLDVVQDAELLYEAIRSMKQRSEEHTSELQSLMRISYAVF